MTLINIKQASYASVSRLFYKTQRRELRLIKKANKKFGDWIEAEISLKDLMNVYLLHHRTSGCGGFSFRLKDFIIVPFTGLKVIDAYENLNKNMDEYKKNSKKCYANFIYQKNKILKNKIEPIILAESRLEINISSGWIKNYQNFIVLDGLHRSLALMNLKKPKLIKAFIAVKNIQSYI